jgi:tellurite resistance protein
MPAVIIWSLLIVALTAVISLGILYVQFQKWQPYVWKQRVVRRIADLRGRRAALTAPDPDGVQARGERLAGEFFHRHLQTLSVDLLAEYPGIGPGTVERVRKADGRTLADLQRYPFQSINGIGPSKARDLQSAVAKLVREAQSRFDAGGCPEAVAYRRKWAGLQARERDHAAARQHELTAVDAALRDADGLRSETRDITFWNFLFRRATAGPTDETMSRPLPSGEPAAPAVPVAKLVSPAKPPAPPEPVGQPVSARSTPPPAFPPATARPAAKPQARVDIFAAELANAKPPAPVAADDHPDLPKLWALARFGFVVAKADGRVAQAEVKVIRAFLVETFGHAPSLVRHIDPLMERTAARVPPEAETLADVLKVATPAEYADLYRFAERVADASGERNHRERDMLARVAASFGFQPTPLPPMPPQPPPAAETAPDPRVMLEIQAGVAITADLVRRRFTNLMDRLDPTKVATLGPEFAAMAAKKRDQVRVAAVTLLAPLGEPLETPAAAPPADLRHNPDLDDAFGG